MSEQFFGGPGDEVGEEPGFESQPEAFDGIEVGRIGRKVLRGEVMPVEPFDFVPRGVVHDQVAPFVGVVGHTLGG